MSVGRFLGGIMALVREVENGRYLLLQRASTKDVGAGTWECVTGRVDQGESFEEALYREAQEEIGTTLQIEFILGTTHFFRGPSIPENELLGIAYACTIPVRQRHPAGRRTRRPPLVHRRRADRFSTAKTTG
jgi:8-oxo-dGTP diphosphatase